MTSRAIAALLAAGLAGCGAAPRLAPADLAGTRWREICPDPAIATAYVRLQGDGLLLWSYRHPDSLQVDSVHTWAVEDGALLLRWNEGGATSRYVPGPDPVRLESTGSTFCLAGPRLERFPPTQAGPPAEDASGPDTRSDEGGGP